VTLDDLERPKHSCGKDASYGPHQKNLNADIPILFAAQCRSVILVSGKYKVHVEIRRGSSEEGASDESGIVDDDIFMAISAATLRKL